MGWYSLRIGQIGLGNWGSRVEPIYRQLQQDGCFDKFVTFDVNQKVSDTTSYADFIKQVDGVHVCVPNDQHYSVVKQLLSDGKHVLVEKPMTLSRQECHHLIEIASERGLILQVGYILRFSNVLRKTKELIKEKKLGRLYYATLHWTNLCPPMHGASIIWDLLPHPLDIMHFLTGRFPNDGCVQVMDRCFRREKLAETALINLDYTDFMASVELSWVNPLKKRMVLLHGSKASFAVECVNQSCTIYEDGHHTVIPVDQNDTIRGEALNFIQCLQDGCNRYNSHIVGLQNTEVIEYIMRDHQ